MKVNTQKKILGVLIVTILAVAIYSAKTLGDMVTKYQSYKSLHAITSLAHPIHASIESLQEERLKSGIYLTRRMDASFEAFKATVHATDKHLAKFAEQLKITQMLLLSIPENELTETRKTIKQHRESLNLPGDVFNENKSFYTNIIVGFLDFLHKMYRFVDDPDFQTKIDSLIAAEYYKETVANEIVMVSKEVSNPVIPDGQIPLIRQMISDQIFPYEKLMSAQDKEIKATFDRIEGFAEKAALEELHKRFEEKNPSLTGSLADADDYIRKGNAYIKRFTEFTRDMLKDLEKTAKEGKARLKSEMIKAGGIALIIIIILIGLYIAIQKIEVKEE